MSTSPASTIILKSLYRSLLKQSRIIDQSPVHQCFLISKPKKIYIHEYGTPVNVRLYNTDFEIVERILNEFCGGEYFAPSYPKQESKSLQHLMKQYFRFGIPSKYDTLKVLDGTTKNQSNEQILNKYLELAFYSKKRLSYSTNVINKMPLSQQTQFLNAFTMEDTPNDHAASSDDKNNGKFSRVNLASDFSMKSLMPLTSDLSINDASQIHKGTLLISHPLSCLGQPDLYRKIIYIIENSSDRIVGITLNSAHSLFDDNNARKSNQKRKSSRHAMASASSGGATDHNKMSVSDNNCFHGWKGEWNYIGGPVNDQNCPFCILHQNKTFHEKFKQSSIVIIDDATNPKETIYWTWVTADNYQKVYDSLNQITRVIQFKEEQKTEAYKMKTEPEPEPEIEISGKNEENENENKDNVISDAQIISEVGSDENNEDMEDDNDNDITKNEYYESIMNDDGENNFKFYQKYSYWSPEQLVVEIKNNVWFAAKLDDICEEKQLLNLKCPSSKLLKLKKDSPSRNDYKKQFNKWMWQAFIQGLGHEFKYLAVFPDLNNEQTKEFYSVMEEFHNSWVPDVEHESFDSDDEPEEEGTVW